LISAYDRPAAIIEGVGRAGQGRAGQGRAGQGSDMEVFVQAILFLHIPENTFLN
jgi:hypothetical protein